MSAPTNNRYEIKQLTDILTIPEDRIEAFWPDLKCWYQQTHALSELLKTTAEISGIQGTIEVATQGMTWIDDDKGEIRITLVANDTN